MYRFVFVLCLSFVASGLYAQENYDTSRIIIKRVVKSNPSEYNISEIHLKKDKDNPSIYIVRVDLDVPLRTKLDLTVKDTSGDAGNGWYGNSTKLKDFKKDIGFELRLQSFSYYVYPTSFAFNAAYGLDQFTRIFPTTLVSNQEVTYGKEWRFYFTVLFSFDMIEDMAKKFRF